MKDHLRVLICLSAFWLTPSFPASAQSTNLALSLPINHPLTVPVAGQPSTIWRQTLGRWGEEVAHRAMEHHGYEVIEPKGPSNRGIDRIAVKRIAGRLSEVKLIEVKT